MNAGAIFIVLLGIIVPLPLWVYIGRGWWAALKEAWEGTR